MESTDFCQIRVFGSAQDIEANRDSIYALFLDRDQADFVIACIKKRAGGTPNLRDILDALRDQYGAQNVFVALDFEYSLSSLVIQTKEVPRITGPECV